MTPASTAAASIKSAALQGQPHVAAGGESVLVGHRVEQLYGQLWLAMLMTFAVAGIAAFEFWDSRQRELVTFWWGLVLLVTFCSGALLHAYRRSPTSAERPERWLRWFGIAALGNGACWGFAAAVFLPSHTAAQQVFLSFVLAGMMAAGIPVYSASWPIFAIYAAGVVLPFSYVLFALGSRLLAEIALMVPLFYALNVALAYRLNQVFDSAHRLRGAHARLTREHASVSRRLEHQIAALGEARREVEASGRKLELFAERSPIAVFELDAEGHIVEVNPQAEVLFGYSCAELVGRHLRFLVRPEFYDEFERKWRRVAEAQQPESGMVRSLRRDGMEVLCEWSVTPLVDAQGSTLAILAQGRDITAQLEAARVKKEFTSTLSHELRTPLTSIIGSLQLVNNGVVGALPKDAAELTVVAERNAERLLDLVDDLLDIQKIESGRLTLEPEGLRMDELVREAMLLNKAFAARFGVRYEVQGELPRCEVVADHKRLLQVMTNLLSNAAKFSPEGDAVAITMQREGASVRVAVHDRGPGIPEAFRGRIFSRFAQADSTSARQKGGTGLGLAISKRLIELMQGRIDFDDRAGGGTTFWFELPCK